MTICQAKGGWGWRVTEGRGGGIHGLVDKRAGLANYSEFESRKTLSMVLERECNLKLLLCYFRQILKCCQHCREPF